MSHKVAPGLRGNSGLMGGGLHLNMPFSSGRGFFVDYFPKGERIPHWRRVTFAKARKHPKRVIRCAQPNCRKWAIRIDHSYPWMSGMNACADHLEAAPADD